ncbi:SixA phosphatase family protein [Roseibacillus ishigakijimensis]|uniref:Histidine phosphatase family protein n=1 Tax=Roseibacillus ishigakijimensis TaxID=454146 RepID=A0A934RLX2_9BACT|nr:histidine phosphatase family protein [Roseibacillus ishigakijimensis]MBK1833804.1 histidine phosphatase family protein [Roseibacillus ishigakijimensis]
MELFLVRHGKAEDIAPDRTDAGRRLTSKGWKQARAVGRLLVELGHSPDLVLSSPRERARETAAGILHAAALPEQPVVQEWLDFHLHPETVMAELAALPAELERVVLVGHEPSFSALVNWLLGAEAGYCEMKKAALAHFQLAPPSRQGALLKMLVPPRVLIG